jgi:hypothetical protein
MIRIIFVSEPRFNRSGNLSRDVKGTHLVRPRERLSRNWGTSETLDAELE